jgi:hypothetical protein
MKTETLTMAALLAALITLPVQARAPHERAPQSGGSPILAQARGDATCTLDGRNVPQGMSYCREGYVVRCSARGTWENTGQRC